MNFFSLKSVISFISNVSLFNLLLISFSYQNQNQHLSTSFTFLIRTLQVFFGILGISVPYSNLFYNKNIFQNLRYLICSRIFYFRRKALGKKITLYSENMVSFSKTHSGYPASHRHNNGSALVLLTCHHSGKAITAFIVFHRKDKALNIVWLASAAYKNCRKRQALRSPHLPSPRAVHGTAGASCYAHCKSQLFSINLSPPKDCYCYFSSQGFHLFLSLHSFYCSNSPLYFDILKFCMVLQKNTHWAFTPHYSFQVSGIQ